MANFMDCLWCDLKGPPKNNIGKQELTPPIGNCTINRKVV